MKAIGRFISALQPRSRSNSPAAGRGSSPSAADADGLPFAPDVTRGLKKAIAFLDAHLSTTEELFEATGKAEEVAMLETLILRGTVSDTLLRSVTSLHSLAQAIKSLFMRLEPLIPVEYYTTIVGAQITDIEGIAERVLRERDGLVSTTMDLLARLAFGLPRERERTLRMPAQTLARAIGIYLLRPTRSSAAVGPPLSEREIQERSDAFLELLGAVKALSRRQTHTHAHGNAHNASAFIEQPSSMTANRSHAGIADLSLTRLGAAERERESDAAPVFSIQDRSVKVLFLNPANRPSQETLIRALSSFGTVVNVGFKEKLAVVLFAEPEPALRCALEQDGRFLGSDFKIKYLGSKSLDELRELREREQTEREEEMPTIATESARDSEREPPPNTHSVHNTSAYPTPHKSSQRETPLVEESFRLHSKPPAQAEQSLGFVDVSRISRHDESTQHLDTSAIPSSDNKPRRRESLSAAAQIETSRYISSSENSSENSREMSSDQEGSVHKDNREREERDTHTDKEKQREKVNESGWRSVKSPSQSFSRPAMAASAVKERETERSRAISMLLVESTERDSQRDSSEQDSLSLSLSVSRSRRDEKARGKVKESTEASMVLPNRVDLTLSRFEKSSSSDSEVEAQREREREKQRQALQLLQHQKEREKEEREGNSPLRTGTLSHTSSFSVSPSGSVKKRRQVRKVQVASPPRPQTSLITEQREKERERETESDAESASSSSAYIEEHSAPSSPAHNAPLVIDTGREPLDMREKARESDSGTDRDRQRRRRGSASSAARESDVATTSKVTWKSAHAVKTHRNRESESESDGSLRPLHSSTTNAPLRSPQPDERGKTEGRETHSEKRMEKGKDKEKKKEKDKTKVARGNSESEQERTNPTQLKPRKDAKTMERNGEMTAAEIADSLNAESLRERVFALEGVLSATREQLVSLQGLHALQQSAFKAELVKAQIENRTLRDENERQRESLREAALENTRQSAMISSLSAAQQSAQQALQQRKEKLQRESYSVVTSQQTLIATLEQHVQELQRQRDGLAEELREMAEQCASLKKELVQYKEKEMRRKNQKTAEHDNERSLSAFARERSVISLPLSPPRESTENRVHFALSSSSQEEGGNGSPRAKFEEKETIEELPAPTSDLSTLRMLTKEEVKKFIEKTPVLQGAFSLPMSSSSQQDEFVDPHNENVAPSAPVVKYADIIRDSDGSHSNPYDPAREKSRGHAHKYSDKILREVELLHNTRRHVSSSHTLSLSTMNARYAPSSSSFSNAYSRPRNDFTDIKNYLAEFSLPAPQPSSRGVGDGSGSGANGQRGMSYYTHLRAEINKLQPPMQETIPPPLAPHYHPPNLNSALGLNRRAF